MSGAGGQWTLIIPSHDLVVVRLGHYRGACARRTQLQRRARAADAGAAQKGVSMIDCENGISKLNAAKAMLSMCHRSCLPPPTR